MPEGEGGREDRRAVRGRATRAAVLKAARELFADRGYAAVGTTEVVERAGVTRGALYHHFEDKRALFRAVYEELEREVAERLVAAVAAEPRPEAHLEVGVDTFLDACLEPPIRRISLLEAPSVLGYEEWRSIGAEYSFGLLRAALEAAMHSGEIEPQPVDTLAHLMLGALAEAALVLARADDLATARAEVGRTVARLLEGLRPRAAGEGTGAR
jgi:AcrR family transcriptional regulator